MKKIGSICAIAAALTLAGCGAEKAAQPTETKQEAVKLQSEIQKQSYSLGVSVATNLTQHVQQSTEMGIALEQDLIAKGFADTLAGNAQIDIAEVQTLLQKLQQQQQEAHAKKQEADSVKFKEEGATFLAENGKKEGIQTTESGLQFEVVSEGEGEKPAAEDTVTVHYTGTLIDGTKFDSSVDRGQPASFPLNRVIKGWTEGLQLMPVGSKFRFYIPFDLAYGPQGTGSIPPFATLIFDVELLSIEGK
ncbi:FKBP-type peptidyl-prolyl cis-trans isomerase [Catenovulum sp. SM1970]|uniref:FKBP-type peptidyl-prolyl cis-trans isomerase n=1 Tax=Marinifaba aquimaris TaxID=2741323 RepID=UPI00157207CE|nr:FKBP-type peptidyl-prolyl cis-trans isomerase [Marinifaba aquimaris]NTS75681.1 FKBP-type peptidyl-prolyl cis-trans isomerase [Marinifaba aquimaris]